MSKAAKKASPFLRRLIGRIVFWIIALFVIWGVAAYFIQRRVLFPREMATQSPHVMKMIRGLEQVWIDTPQGKVEGWFMPAPGRSKENPGPAVMFAHGNAELIDDQPHFVEPYRAMGISVLLVEFRGYGRSAGTPSQGAITEDFKQFHAWLTARPEVNPRQLIYHGRSLGGGALFALAKTHPPAAMILESTFESAVARYAAFGIPRFLCRDPFDSIAVIRTLDCPILLFHGSRDSVVPHRDSVALQAAARSATLITLDSDHNGPADDRIYWQHIEPFLKTINLVE